MRDSAADVARRAWVPCARCPDGSDCGDCTSPRNCHTHWRFLLAAEGPQLFVQCPACDHRWWHDSKFGVGGRPEQVDHIEYERFDVAS